MELRHFRFLSCVLEKDGIVSISSSENSVRSMQTAKIVIFLCLDLGITLSCKLSRNVELVTHHGSINVHCYAFANSVVPDRTADYL